MTPSEHDELQKALRVLAERIVKTCREEIEKAHFDKTYTAKIVGVKSNNQYVVEYNGKQLTVKGQPSARFNLGDYVRILSPQNNIKNTIIIPKTGSSGDPSEGGNSHTHSNLDVLHQLNAKHNHSTLDIVRGGNENWADNIGSTNRAMINTARSPKSAFLPANCITVEYSSDAGKTWEDYGLSEAQKRGLFALTCDNDVRLSKSSPVSTNDCVRITVEPLDRYVSFDQLYIWFSTGSHACTLDLERSTIGAKDTFSFIRKDVPLGGWSGPNVINFPYGTFGGFPGQTSNHYKYRMTFKTTKLGSSTTQSPAIIDIRFYGDRAWTIPNDMVKGDYPFSWDRDMNVNFSKQLKEQGKRVYSDNNKPTPAAIGAATAEQGIKADAALPKSGGTMTGFITLHAAPTANMHPATKKYVDDKMIAAGNGDNGLVNVGLEV